MASKEKQLSPIIKLDEKAAEKFIQQASAPLSAVQKSFIDASRGVYSFYREQWKK